MIRQGFTVELDRDLGDAAAFAAEHGFEFLELNMDHTFERGRIDPERVRETVERYDLDLAAHLPYRLDPGSPHEHVREGACRELAASVDTAAACGADRAVFHATSRARPEKWPRDEIRDLLFESVRRVADHADDAGVVPCVENVKTPFFDAGEFPALFEETDAAACLDTGHAYVTGQDGNDQARLLREHGDRIAHVHLNETRRGDDDEHLPVGLGRIDFGAIASAMVETDWSGTCTHELFQFDDRYLAHSKAAFDDLR